MCGGDLRSCQADSCLAVFVRIAAMKGTQATARSTNLKACCAADLILYRSTMGDLM